MASPRSVHLPFRSGKRASSSSAGEPDLAAAAREAVVSFLHDSSVAAPERAAAPAAAAASPKASTSTVTRVRIPAGLGAPGATADSAAVRAAATLERIEAAAAKVEADIQQALQKQAELQAGAGAAAEAAVRAAEQSWIAAHKSVAAEGRARVILGLMTRYLAVTIALVVITLIFLIITASTAH
jgi:hypothetical protein